MISEWYSILARCTLIDVELQWKGHQQVVTSWSSGKTNLQSVFYGNFCNCIFHRKSLSLFHTKDLYAYGGERWWRWCGDGKEKIFLSTEFLFSLNGELETGSNALGCWGIFSFYISQYHIEEFSSHFQHHSREKTSRLAFCVEWRHEGDDDLCLTNIRFLAHFTATSLWNKF